MIGTYQLYHQLLCDLRQVSQPLCVLDIELEKEEKNNLSEAVDLYLSKLQPFLGYCLGSVTAA